MSDMLTGRRQRSPQMRGVHRDSRLSGTGGAAALTERGHAAFPVALSPLPAENPALRGAQFFKVVSKCGV